MTNRALKNFKKRQLTNRVLRSKHLGKPEEIVDETVEPKGQKGGRCNVTACQAPGAVFHNVGMISTGGSWYCVSCASDINEANVQDVERGCGFTLFPEFDTVLNRYRALRREGKDPRDISLYEDINQNPWGSCYHFDRDKYYEKLNRKD